jgi:hypothetical protein
MKVTGGYKSETKGFHVTLTPLGSTEEKSVSVWDVKHLDEIEKERLFKKIFHLSSAAACSIDRNKGVPGLAPKTIHLSELPRQEKSYELAVDNIAV